MKKNPDVVDEYLEAVEGMKEAETNSFFYTRLKARMERQQEWSLPLRPAWMIAALSLLLLINGFIVSQQYNNKKDTTIASSPLQNFAAAYNLTIQSTY